MTSTHILCVGTIVRGEIEMDVSMPPWLDPHESIELPRLSEEDEMSEEYESWLEDVDFFRTGC